MTKVRILYRTAFLLLLATAFERSSPAAEKPPHITSISVPQGGATTILFHGVVGPYRVQTRTTFDPAAAWLDIPEAKVTEVQPGVFLALIPRGLVDTEFYRVVSEREVITDLKGWTLLVQTSPPANRQFFVAGETPLVTVQILDTFAQGISRADFATLNLYVHGPEDPQQTVTPSKLLNASRDRAARPHHYIDLKANPEVQVKDNVLSYKLRPITDEAPGTYTVSVWSSLAADGIQQIMKFASFQIGTATVETPVVTREQCAKCHLGASNGKMYMHHVDPGRSPTGNWSLDYDPVKSCKPCHNNDGYAAIRDASGAYVVDPTVRRAHGVHMGEGLKLDFNTNSVSGSFRDYVHLKFPADVRNCTVCHADDRWKTDASRMACGSCHDNVWFGDKSAVPTGMVAHKGGVALDDSRCSLCHEPTSVVEAHHVAAPAFKQVVKLEMSPPADGKAYVAGEMPKVIIKATDATTGAVVDPKTIVEPLVSTNVAPNEWRRANLFVSGPRADTKPVLTRAALEPNPNGYYANNDIRVRVDPAKEDPRVSRTADAIVYQLADVAGLAPGTYTAFVEVMPASPLGGWGYVNFQVGTATPEPPVAASCVDCHFDTRIHGGYFAVSYEPDICKTCHDNLHQMSGKIGWAASNNGFGAGPLSRRVHGVHYGKYLDKPKEVHPQYDYSEVIFPQDVRNCTKCHSQNDSWTEKASRLACLACHDSDAAIAHGSLMTFDLTLQDPWSGDEVETCQVCHGKDSELSPQAVHSLSNPYVPPYPRHPAE